jgi:hypothetical protein
MSLGPRIYPMPEISDFQRTNSELVKYPMKITLEYAH